MTLPPWRLHDDVIDDSTGDQEVGGQDEGEDGPGRGHLDDEDDTRMTEMTEG